MILGTRGSDLALTQANMVRGALAEVGISCELRVVKTIGDKRPDLKLSEFGASEAGVHDKGVFTRELEEALAAGEIDFAVHSLKDVPTELAPEFEICAVLPRAPVSDVILAMEEGTVQDLTGLHQEPNRVRSVFDPAFRPFRDHSLHGKTVATSSVRRARFLQWIFPGVSLAEIRGNVPTRIGKLVENPDWDAIVLARAGLERLGLRDPARPGCIDFPGATVFCRELPPEFFPPAASQGAVAMEIRKDHSHAKEALRRINDAATFVQITAERSFLAALEAGCQTPVGVLSQFCEDDGARFEISAAVFSESDADSGEAPKVAQTTARVDEAEQVGAKLVRELD